MDGIDAIKYILINNIDGVIIECGVASGNFEYICINELIKNNTHRDIYLYDTFAGMVEPGEYDYTRNDAVIYSWNKEETYNYWKNNIINENANNWLNYSLDTVKNRLNSTGYPQNKLHYIVGDVMNTLKDKSNIPDKIAILRLDTDWYESSKFEFYE